MAGIASYERILEARKGKPLFCSTTGRRIPPVKFTSEPA